MGNKHDILNKIKKKKDLYNIIMDHNWGDIVSKTDLEKIIKRNNLKKFR